YCAMSVWIELFQVFVLSCAAPWSWIWRLSTPVVAASSPKFQPYSRSPALQRVAERFEALRKTDSREVLELVERGREVEGELGFEAGFVVVDDPLESRANS